MSQIFLLSVKREAIATSAKPTFVKKYKFVLNYSKFPTSIWKVRLSGIDIIRNDPPVNLRKLFGKGILRVKIVLCRVENFFD